MSASFKSVAGMIAGSVMVAIFCDPGNAAAADIGFVSLVHGRPVLQDAAGRKAPMKLMQSLEPDSLLVLDANDAVGICHEPAATSYRIEGAGTVRISRDKVAAESGAAKILTVGRCGGTASSSETGGVLLRSVQKTK